MSLEINESQPAFKLHNLNSLDTAEPGCRAVKEGVLLPIACWDFGDESHPKHEYLSLVTVVFCQVICAKG